MNKITIGILLVVFGLVLAIGPTLFLAFSMRYLIDATSQQWWRAPATVTALTLLTVMGIASAWIGFASIATAND